MQNEPNEERIVFRAKVGTQSKYRIAMALSGYKDLAKWMRATLDREASKYQYQSGKAARQ